MINFKNIDWFKTVILVLIVLFVLSWWQGRQQDKADTAQLINALQDTVKVSIDKYGDKVSQIAQIRTDKPQTFLTIKSGDAEIQRLQAEVKKYKSQIKQNGSVTVFSSSVAVDTTFATTIKPDGSVSGQAMDEWYSVQVNSGRVKLGVKNSYTVALVEEGGQGVVKIKNENPYSTEGEIRTYAPLPKQTKRWGVGPFAGIDATGKISAGAAVSWHLMEW
jgi:hypothetical protein